MPRKKTQPPRTIIFLTGLSGAGLTSAHKHLEDMGYEVFDSLPFRMIDDLIASNEPGSPPHPIAFVVDTRTRQFSADSLISMMNRLKQNGHNVRLLFLSCDEAVIVRRFTETRRIHPLAKDRPVADAIGQERRLLSPLRAEADLVIDTSELSIHDLRHLLEGHLRPQRHTGMTLTVMSFAYRSGLPREADIVFDMRFLRNPHWKEDLRPLTGEDPRVGAFIEEDPAFATFFSGYTATLEPLLERYAHEGKTYLTLAFGCTGGRHRSVYTAEKLALWLEERSLKPHLRHRDLGRDRARAEEPRSSSESP